MPGAAEPTCEAGARQVGAEVVRDGTGYRACTSMIWPVGDASMPRYIFTSRADISMLQDIFLLLILIARQIEYFYDARELTQDDASNLMSLEESAA